MHSQGNTGAYPRGNDTAVVSSEIHKREVPQHQLSVRPRRRSAWGNCGIRGETPMQNGTELDAMEEKFRKQSARRERVASFFEQWWGAASCLFSIGFWFAVFVGLVWLALAIIGAA